MGITRVLLDWQSLQFSGRMQKKGGAFVIDTRARLNPMPGARIQFRSSGGRFAQRTWATVSSVQQLSDSSTRLVLVPAHVRKFQSGAVRECLVVKKRSA